MVSGAGDTEPETPDQRRCLLTSFPGVGAVAGGREVAAQYFLCAASVCWWQSVLPVRCHSHGIRSGFFPPVIPVNDTIQTPEAHQPPDCRPPTRIIRPAITPSPAYR